MPVLLDRSPIPAQPSLLFVQDEQVRIRANQIIVWATLTPRPLESPNPAARPFPVIIDTGHTHSLAIQERHLIEWARINPESLLPAGFVRERGRRLTLRHANIWLHTNRPGSWDHLSDQPPHSVGADPGIAV